MVPRFRCWFKDSGTQAAHMVEWHELRQFKALGDLLEYSGENKSFHLMQSTGLKDKNGVDIFEGDVLNIIEVTDQGLKEYLTDVKWEDCSFVVKSGGDDYDTFLAAWTSDPNTTYPLFEIQVVGNIYENPELLEQTNEN